MILATIGVYFGLVLVGASPVLGHAATTRNFEISDEIEINDDLDRKPDDKPSPLAMSIGNYYADLELFIESLERLQRNGKFNLSVDTFELSQSTALPCVAGNNVGSYTAESFVMTNAALRPTLEWIEKRLTDGYAFGDCVPSERFDGQEATQSRFALNLDADNGLTLEVTGLRRSPADANAFLRELTHGWNQFRAQNRKPIEKYVSDGTTLGVSGAKILVVTRLPRAALNTLLAEDAK